MAWIRWPEDGDGAGNLDDGAILWRNMLPSHNFPDAVQNVIEVGTEEEVMGDYYPKTRYTSKEEFEDLGKKPWEYLPYDNF